VAVDVRVELGAACPRVAVGATGAEVAVGAGLPPPSSLLQAGSAARAAKTSIELRERKRLMVSPPLPTPRLVKQNLLSCQAILFWLEMETA
jgi:hypothetical protein